MGPTFINVDDVVELILVSSETPSCTERPNVAGYEDIAIPSDGIDIICLDEDDVADNVTVESEAEDGGKLANRLVDQLI